MKIEIDYKIGMPIYLKADEDQSEYRLNRIIIEQKQLLSLELFDSMTGALFEVSEIHCSKDKDVNKTMGISKKEDEED